MVTTSPLLDADSLRLRHEFLAAPTLSLTVAQVARLLDIRVDHAAAILEMFVDEEWLMQSPEGHYRRREPSSSRCASCGTH